MRVVVLILAILGSLPPIGLGALWLQDIHFPSEQSKTELKLALALGGNQVWQEYSSEVKRRARTFPILIAAGVLGIVGGILAMKRRKYGAASLLIVAGIGPGALHPITLIFTVLMPIAGLLALTVSAPAADDQSDASGHSKSSRAQGLHAAVSPDEEENDDERPARRERRR